MKSVAFVLLVIFGVAAGACDVQSGITKKSVEKYAPTPSPEKIQTPDEAIDPNDVINVDTSGESLQLNFNIDATNTTIDCKKYDRVLLNTVAREITIKGACKQLMVNGDRNRIVSLALTEVVFNGGDNHVQFSKYVNGKKPLVMDNGSGNVLEKYAATETDYDKKKK